MNVLICAVRTAKCYYILAGENSVNRSAEHAVVKLLSFMVDKFVFKTRNAYVLSSNLQFILRDDSFALPSGLLDIIKA